MPAAHADERLVAAHSEMKRASDLLIAPSPDAWIACQEALDRAISQLSDFRTEVQQISVGAGDRSLACDVRAEVLRASQLLQNLSSFYRGWERILGTMTAGYTANGDPAPVARNGQLCCKG